MTVRVKWREEVFEDLKARASALGWEEFDEEKLSGLIKQSAEKDPDENGFSSSLYKAYVRAASFSGLGRKRFLNALQAEWGGSTSSKKRVYRKKDGDVVPSMIDPDCKACDGTGVNSKQAQCDPCLKNGVKVKARPKGRKHSTKPPSSPSKGGERNRKVASREQSTKPPLPPPPPKRRPPPPPKGKKAPPPPPPKRRPPPPPKRRPPPAPPQKKKAKASKPPPARPLSPPKVGKTYGPQDGATPPRLKAPVFFAVCIQVRLDSSYDESVVVEELNRYVVEKTGFGANVQEAKQLGSEVFDLRVHYAVHMTEVFDAIEAHEWVKDAQVRPVQDLGQGEPIL